MDPALDSRGSGSARYAGSRVQNMPMKEVEVQVRKPSMGNPEMEHADDNMVTVAPSKSGEIIWQFTKAGKVDFACLQPGHYDAGMKGLVTVAGSKVPQMLPDPQ